MRGSLPADSRALVPSFPNLFSARRLRSQAHIMEKAEDHCFDSFLALHPSQRTRAASLVHLRLALAPGYSPPLGRRICHSPPLCSSLLCAAFLGGHCHA